MRVRVFILLLLIPLMNCNLEKERQSKSHRVSMRFVEETKEQFFEDSTPFVEYEEFVWSLADSDEQLSWRAFPKTSDVTSNKDSLKLCSDSRRAYLLRDTDFLADEIQALDVQATGPGLSRARLCWGWSSGADADQGCTVARRNDRGIFRFEVLKHPEWSGRIKRISLTPLVERDNCTDFHQITGKSFRAEPKRMKAALERSWKVTLTEGPYGVTRGCLLSNPGVPLVRRIIVGPQAVFRFFFGLEPGVRGSVTFLVKIQGNSNKPPETVFRETIHSEKVLQGSGWHEAQVDLNRYAGDEVDLILETEADERGDVVRGFPVWGHPEIIEGHHDRPPNNLILISVDTLRADRMSLYGYDRETTPNIDRWARQRGITFKTTTAPSPWTIPSHASIFTGLDALSHGMNHVQKIPGNQKMLAGLLREAGYQTAAITGGGFLAPEFGFSNGFDRYLHWSAPAVGENELESGIDHLVQWLERFPDGPFFFFFHTYEVHSPYRPRQPFYSRFTGGPPRDSRLIGERNQKVGPEDGFRTRRQWIWLSDPTKLREGVPLVDSEIAMGSDYYDSQIAFLDSHIGHLLNVLETTGLDENTVVIITSDHGESLGEAGLMGHTNLQDSNLLVPLIIGLPAEEYGGSLIERPVRLIDIFPTVLDLLEIESDPEIDGESLAPLMLGGRAGGPGEAWSYAGKYNGGVSLRVGNRSKYVFNDTAWTSVWGEDDLQDLGDTWTGDPDSETRQSMIETFRSQVKNRLDSTARGLQIQFNNSASVQFSGSLTGESIDVARLKSSGPTPNLTYSDWRTINFVIPGEQTFSVILETPTVVGKINVFVSIAEEGQETSYKAEVDIDPDFESWTLCRKENSWSEEGPPEESDCTGIILRWRNQPVQKADQSDEVQPELLDQLHALGYVEE